MAAAPLHRAKRKLAARKDAVEREQYFLDDEKYIEELFYVTGLLKRGESINSFISFRISSSWCPMI